MLLRDLSYSLFEGTSIHHVKEGIHLDSSLIERLHFLSLAYKASAAWETRLVLEANVVSKSIGRVTL